MQEINGKNILLLAPSYFGYDLEIKNTLKKLGANVYHYDERPKNDFFTKVFIRLNLKKIIQKNIDSYYEKIIQNTRDLKLDYLLLINPEAIDNKKIEKIKQYHSNIKVLIYMWDSIKNKKKSLELLKNSDKFFTFDSEDEKNYKDILFLPLFYIDDYKNISISSNYEYDFAFIGTIHSDRYNIVKKIEKFSQENNLKIYFYFYSPSRILFFLQRLFKKDFRNIDRNDISYIPMNKNDIISVVSKSRIIVDIQHPFQNGLTMRSIEMLGAKRKLLTTNKSIIGYDFYNAKNIAILDRNNIEISINFIKTKYEEINNEVYQKYSIYGWLQNIFKGEK